MRILFRFFLICFVFLTSIFAASAPAWATEWGFSNCLSLGSGDVANDPSVCATCRLACLKGIAPPLVAGCQLNLSRVCVTAAAKAALEGVEEATCAEGPQYGCCIEVINDAEAQTPNGGTGEIQKEDCKDGRVQYYGDCFCKNQEGTSQFEKPAYSPDACTELCTGEKLTVDETRGIGAYKRLAAASAGGPSQSTLQFVNALCFSSEECSDAGGTWESSTECTTGKGKCLAPEPQLTLSSPILGQTSVTGLRGYVSLGFRFLLAITVLAATIAFMWGGIKYIIGATSGDISSAKTYMTNAVIGLLLVFGAITLLNTLNPETTRYDKLKIYLINKEEFSKNEFCKDFIGKAGKPVKYADAGNPPGAIAYESAAFTIDLAKTKCGSEYYVEGFGGKTCKGLVCESESEVCLACKAGITECFGNTKGSVCVPVAIAVELKYSGGAKPRDAALVAVCNYIQPGDNEFTLSYVEGNVPESVNLDFTDGGSDTVIFRKTVDATVANDLSNACKDHGGLRGVVLAVRYDDTSGLVGTIASATSGPNPNNRDVLIMGKRDCTGAASKFSGYADGGLTSSLLGDAQSAIFCGYQNDYNPYFGGSDLYWTPDELSAAFSGSGKAIDCHSTLSSTNAPGDPKTKFYPTCSP